jgi:hypothetical protein
VVELTREPEPKIGPTANALEKHGIETERGNAFRAAQARNAERREWGWRQLELLFELAERGRAFVAVARERIGQLWQRAEAAMGKIKERVMGQMERSDGAADREARRAAVLGRGGAEVQRQDKDFGRERVAPVELDPGRRDAILGRHKNDGQERGPGPGRDRERER